MTATTFASAASGSTTGDGRVTRVIGSVIDVGKNYAVVPWQMAIVAKLLRLLPNRVFDAALAGRGRKPRDTGR